MHDPASAYANMAAFPGAAVLDHVSDAVIAIDHAGRVTYANPAARLLGDAALPPEACQLGEQARRLGSAVEQAGGGWWRRASPTADGGLIIIARPHTMATAKQTALHQTREHLRELFEHAPIDMVVLLVDPDGAVVVESANAAFYRTTGLSPAALTGRRLDEVLDCSTAAILAADARTCIAQGSLECQQALSYPVGERMVRTYYRAMVEEDAERRRVVLTQIDLTESRRIEAALRQALRLEVVGQLTGGVAHDFNNLLTAILASLELLGGTVADARQKRWVRVATEAAQRGATLTQQLLAYARKQFLAPKATDIPAAIGGMTELIRGSLGGQITLETRFAAGTWLAHTDIAQLELALLNLVVNARAAMPHGGRLVLSTRNLAAGDPSLPPELERGAFVGLAVTDDGQGMEPEVLARAMEPFFTTKGVGEGSGLGLSQAYGFARQLGGTLRLTSQPGQGTVAEILLPRAAPLQALNPGRNAAPGF
jgi:PAS domain S-box-containing protein